MENASQPRITLHPLLVDIWLTTATQFAVLFVGLAVVSLLGRTVGAIALGEYLLLRRVYAWLQAVALLGMGGGLTRYVAHSEEKPDSERAGYFLAAVACGGAVTLGLVVVLNVTKSFSGRWLFGSVQMAHLIFPLSLMLVAGAAHKFVYGYHRGRLAMKRANALQFCTLVFVPLGAVLAFFRTGSVALIVNAMSVLTILCAGLFALPILPELRTGSQIELRRHAAEMLRYGIPRVPGGFANGALFALGPIIAAHYLPVGEVSYLLLGVSVLMAVATTAEPLGSILLSKVSMILAQDRLSELRTHLAYLQAAVLELYVFACLQVVVFADVVVRVWVGPSFLGGLVILRLVSLAIPSYLLFVALRSVVDAASVRPHNTNNVLVACAVFLLLTAVAVRAAPRSLLLASIAGSLVVAIGILAWLTNHTVRKLYQVGVEWRRSALPLLVGVFLAGTSLLFHWAQEFRTGLGLFLLIEMATGVVFLGLLKQMGSPWIPFFWQLAFARARPVTTATGDQRR